MRRGHEQAVHAPTWQADRVRSRLGGLPALAAADDVGVDCGDDDHAGDDHLPFLGHGHDAQAVDEHAHDECADDRAQDGAFAAAERGAADDHRGDGVQFIACAQGRLGRIEARGNDHTGQAAEDPAQGIDRRLPQVDIDARQARGFFVAAQRHTVAAQDGLANTILVVQ